MRPTDFSTFVSSFISNYLPNERGASKNTITAYRDTFVLLINYIEKEKKINIGKIKISDISKATIVEFLNWLQSKRNNGNSTRNARLAAIHSFYKYLRYQRIEYMDICQEILSIPFKKMQQKGVNHLSLDGIKLLLGQPDRSTKRGLRDLALISFMYDSAVRVQELIDLTPSDLHLKNPCTVKVLGKGGKARMIPLIDSQIEILISYIKANRLNEPQYSHSPLFSNARKEKLTRSGVTFILRKHYQKLLVTHRVSLPESISCHTLRHSKAMHLLEQGVNLIYIRDILGHTSIKTTEIYARADSRQKRKALEMAYVKLDTSEDPIWENNDGLIDWLKRF